MFTSIAYAQGGEAAGGIGGMLQNLGILPMMIAMFAIFYFFMIRPQQKKQKEHLKMLDLLKGGDEIMTTSGIFGTIDSVIDSNTFLVNIGSGVKIKLLKTGIAGKVDNNRTATPVEEKK